MPDSVRLAVLAVRVPKVPVVEKRLVDEAVVEKKEVVVAAVPIIEPPVMVGLVKIPLVVKEERLEEMWETSVSDWRVTVGRVSVRRMLCLNSTGLMV